MKLVKPKKFLGQHFLKDLKVAQDIADTVDTFPELPILEVGPGMGVLTQFLVKKDRLVKVVEEPANDNPPIDDDEQDRRLPGCMPQATGIRFEDMGLAVRVAVSGEAASEEEKRQAGKTLAELRNTPMFDKLTAGDPEREERIDSLIELHLAAYRRRNSPDSEAATETIPDTFSISDIV